MAPRPRRGKLGLKWHRILECWDAFSPESGCSDWLLGRVFSVLGWPYWLYCLYEWKSSGKVKLTTMVTPRYLTLFDRGSWVLLMERRRFGGLLRLNVTATVLMTLMVNRHFANQSDAKLICFWSYIVAMLEFMLLTANIVSSVK